jgi:hypothetical protein
MRSKYFSSKIVAAVVLIMVVVVYFFFYFIPSLEAINRYKRQVKDMNLKIADFKKASTSFSFPDQRERSYFLRLQRELTAKIPGVAGPGDFIRLFSEISAYIQELAQRDGISNLVIEPGPGELKRDKGEYKIRPYKGLRGSRRGSAGFCVHPAFSDSLPNDLISIAAPRLSRMWKEQQIAAEQRVQTWGSPHRGMDNDLSTLVKGIQYRTIALIFTGQLKNAVNFINHLPWGPYYLVEDKILVNAGDKFPYYIVFLKTYYIGAENAGLKPAPVPGSTPEAGGASLHEEAGQQGLIVDSHSRMLLRRIPPYLLKEYPKKELPQVTK